MQTIIEEKHKTILIVIFFILCIGQWVYAGLDLGFTIPAGTMTIDGASNDWTGIEPIYNDPQGDSICGTGTDIRDVYFAQDSTYLYWRMDTWSGTYAYDLPSEGPTVSIRQLTGSPTAGDVEARVFNHNGISGVIWQHDGSSWIQAFYGPEYGWVNNIAEGKIPLSMFSGAEYTKVYTYYFSGVDGGDCDSLEPSPITDIKANNSDGPLTITQSDPLSITVELDAAGHTDNADWWVLADTPMGWYRYDVWGDTWVSGMNVTYQGPVVDLSTFEVLNYTGLPLGPYTFYFGVDPVMNGSIDMGQILYDSVNVTITP